jgi:CRISPR/Cas system CMR subunit Cmr6 (Cas7 group RAMP superfamily)
MFVKDIYRYILNKGESRLDQIVTDSKNNWSFIGSLLFAIRHEFVNGNNGLYDSIRKKYHKDCLPPSNKADTFQGHLLEPGPDASKWTPPPNLANWLKQPLVEPDLLPAGSFGLCSSFTLATPYLSKDDRPFYWTDNPLRRDKTINLPLVPGSAWKGALLRAATGLVLERSSDEEKQAGRVQLYRLFGDESDSQKRYLDSPDMIPCELPDRSRQGRLRFFPTYFSRVALAMLNPHDRKTRAGKNPINIECVPAGSPGRLFILYCPFDLAGRKWDGINTEVEADEIFVGAAMKEMLEKTGFGAKTSSGFGKAQKVSIDPVFKNYQ